MKTLGLASSSSANASLRASLTITSLTPLGVAYPLILDIAGTETAGVREDLLNAGADRWERRRETGRMSREATIAEECHCRLKERS